MLYEALSVIVGPFLIFTIVKMLRTIINDQTLKKTKKLVIDNLKINKYSTKTKTKLFLFVVNFSTHRSFNG